MEALLGAGIIGVVVYIAFIIALINLIPMYFIFKWAHKKALRDVSNDILVDAIKDVMSDYPTTKNMVGDVLLALAYYKQHPNEINQVVRGQNKNQSNDKNKNYTVVDKHNKFTLKD